MLSPRFAVCAAVFCSILAACDVEVESEPGCAVETSPTGCDRCCVAAFPEAFDQLRQKLGCSCVGDMFCKDECASDAYCADEPVTLSDDCSACLVSFAFSNCGSAPTTACENEPECADAPACLGTCRGG